MIALRTDPEQKDRQKSRTALLIPQGEMWVLDKAITFNILFNI